MIRAIIFDCFGVLVGTGFENTYRAAGGDPIADSNAINDILGRSNLGLISDNDFLVAMAQLLGISSQAWEAAIHQSEALNTDLLSYVKQLRKTYKTAVLSNANIGTLEHRIGEPWLSECFDEVIVSADVHLVKPDRRIYQHTLEKLGVEPSEAVFIDDRQIFTDAAAVLGIHPLLYRGLKLLKTDLEQLLADTKS